MTVLKTYKVTVFLNLPLNPFKHQKVEQQQQQ